MLIDLDLDHGDDVDLAFEGRDHHLVSSVLAVEVSMRNLLLTIQFLPLQLGQGLGIS